MEPLPVGSGSWPPYNGRFADHLNAAHRELVQQVAADARALRRVWGLRVAAVFGGADRAQQIELLAKKPHLLVATPGRLLDLIDEGALSLGARRRQGFIRV